VTHIVNTDSTKIDLDNSVSNLSPWGFPPMPRILPTELSFADAQARWPEFIDTINELSEQRQEPNQPIGLVAPRYMLAGTSKDDAFGLALLLLLPDVCEPYLDNLATQKPGLYNRNSLDLMQSETIFEWSTQLGDDKCYQLLVPELPISVHMLSSWHGSRTAVSWIHVIFVTGTRIVSGGFWLDSSDIGGMQGACGSSGFNYRPHRIWSEEVLIKAANDAKECGSATPWKTGVWCEEGKTWMYQAEILIYVEPPEPEAMTFDSSEPPGEPPW